MHNQNELMKAEGRFAGNDIASGVDLMVFRHANLVGAPVNLSQSRGRPVDVGGIEVDGAERTYTRMGATTLTQIQQIVNNLRACSSMLTVTMVPSGFTVTTTMEDLRRFTENEYLARQWMQDHPDSKVVELFDEGLPWYEAYRSVRDQIH